MKKSETAKFKNAKLRRISGVMATLLIICVLLPSMTVFADDMDEVIRVGWVTHPGLQNYEDGVFSGYTYDYLMEIADYTGWTYEFVPNKVTVLNSLNPVKSIL